ncbi:dihydrolipoyl dehydrogenase family protein [Bacillus salacetis]|uniref:dihydrolipoyl dehydrogenase family protein n=1 Tax=Bacillus salacetis TaxID=2315464 RepID=UPI003BA26F03
MKKFDLIVIGAGAGGLTVAAGAASLGATVALIEKNPELGGDCLHYGCVPSKALITSAKKVYQARKTAEEFGLDVEGEASIEQAMNRVKEAIAEIQHHDSKDRFRKLGVEIYRGKGRFVDPHVVQIDEGEKIRGKRVVISTGSRPNIPPIEGLKEAGFITNETIFDVKKPPKHLIVIGGGPIGLEMAQSFARFGSEVTIIEAHDMIFGKEDQDIQKRIFDQLKNELSFLLNAKVKRVETKDGKKSVMVEVEGKEVEIEGDEILLSAGRKPNTDQLNLEEIGVKSDRGVIKVNEYLQTSVSHIYAIGDTNGQFPFTHAAGMEGKMVVRNAVFGVKGKVNYDHVPWVTFTDPEVFHIGLTEEEAREKHSDVKVYSVSSKDVDRFVTDRDTTGFVKIITDKKGYILGAHAVGENAGDWMQEIVLAKTQNHKIGEISNVIHPYPTHGSIVSQAADQYWREKLFKGVIPKIAKKYIQWFR